MVVGEPNTQQLFEFAEVLMARATRSNVPAEIGGTESLNDIVNRAAALAAASTAERILTALRTESLGPIKVWFSQQEAAAYLGMSEPFLCTLVKQGKAPQSVKRGNHRRFKREWLDGWLLASNEEAGHAA